MTIAAATLAFLRTKAEHPDVFVVSISAGDLLDLLNAYEEKVIAPDNAKDHKSNGPAGCLRTADRA